MPDAVNVNVVIGLDGTYTGSTTIGHGMPTPRLNVNTTAQPFAGGNLPAGGISIGASTPDSTYSVSVPSPTTTLASPTPSMACLLVVTPIAPTTTVPSPVNITLTLTYTSGGGGSGDPDRP